MNTGLKFPKRRSIRLPHWDYSTEGYYFVTICSQNREHLFGKIMKDCDQPVMVLNDAGKMINYVWQSLPKYHPVILDQFQIMPNHIHGIIQINRATTRVAPTNEIQSSGIRSVGAGLVPARLNKLGNIIGTFKSLTMHEYINGVKNNDWKKFDKRLWQRNYYEHIIRHEKELNQIREYILINPARWQYDGNNPENDFCQLAKLAIKGGPLDLSKNMDVYLYR